MATSFGSAASFTNGNMKPASGEQIDSLWGQNIADNTGFLRSMRMPFWRTTGSNGLATTAEIPGLTFKYPLYVLRVSGHNRLVGTFRTDGTFANTGSPDCTGTFGAYFLGDLGTYGGTSTFATSNIGGNFTIGSTIAFEINLDSYLSVGSWGTMWAYAHYQSTDGTPGGAQTAWVFDEVPKVYTTWAA